MIKEGSLGLGDMGKGNLGLISEMSADKQYIDNMVRSGVIVLYRIGNRDELNMLRRGYLPLSSIPKLSSSSVFYALTLDRVAEFIANHKTSASKNNSYEVLYKITIHSNDIRLLNMGIKTVIVYDCKDKQYKIDVEELNRSILKV